MHGKSAKEKIAIEEVVYTFMFRASPPPTLNVFDAPDGYSTCTRRIRSNTPLQALTLLNDATSVEFAAALKTMIDERDWRMRFGGAHRGCLRTMNSNSEVARFRQCGRVLLNLMKRFRGSNP